MSIRVMSLVWELDLPDSEKLVLLALADCANDEGHCWPGMNALTKKCSKSDRTVQLSIKALCAKGHLTRREVLGKGCNYTVHPAQSPIPTGETHYLYRTENPTTGEFYIGARSCFGDPQADRYMGSGEWVKEQAEAGTALVKTIISTFGTREELGVAEQAATASVFGQPLCRNRKIATPETLSPRSRFAPKGTTRTPEAASGKPSRTINPKKDKPSSGVRAKKPPHPLPDDWEPKELAAGSICAQIATTWQPGRMERELSKFRDHHLRSDARWSDWDAAWRTWIQKAGDFENVGRTNRLDGQSASNVTSLRGNRPDPALDLLRAARAAEDREDHWRAGASLPSIGPG